MEKRKLAIAALLFLFASQVALLPGAWGQNNSIDFSTQLQRIDGFGVAEAFQRVPIMRGSQGLSPDKTQQLVDLLFDPKNGLGLSILRIGIKTDSNIEPNSPGSPTATPQYVWDGSDGGQVWLAQQAQSYGVNRFYADAWSAPAFMKTNSSTSNGGGICGLQGTTCLDGQGANPQTATPAVGDDWRQAYANYLVQFLKFYQQAGIQITDVGFTNEPDLSTSYDSMQLSSGQVIDFLKVFGPTLQASQLPVKLVCCDLSNWSKASSYTSAIAADPVAAGYVQIYSGHEYGVAATSPLPAPAGSTTWMSEWGASGSTWNPYWDSGESANTGMVVANDINGALTAGKVNAYIYWYGASTSTTRAFIQMNGPDYFVSKRFWAMAAWSRFVRPNAYRVAASSSDSNLKLSAFRNADGSEVINIINNATTAIQTTFTVIGVPASDGLAAYFTDENNSLAPANNAQLSGQNLSVNLAPRSLTTIVFRDTTPPVTMASASPVPNSNGWNNSAVTVTFTASDPADGVRQISASTSGAQSGSSILAGNSGQITVSAEGSTTLNYFATDNAGNSESAKTTTLNIDLTAPIISTSTPSSGAAYLLNAPVTANYGCNDSLSGIAACTGSVGKGARLNTSAVGARSFNVQAADLAGNIASQDVTYSVQYRFPGFGSPVIGMPYVNTVTAGSTVPIKWQLTDANGAYISSLTSFSSLYSYPVACPGAPAIAISSSSTPGDATPHYDPSSNTFIYNWKTDPSWSGCRALSLSLADGTNHQVLFQFVAH